MAICKPLHTLGVNKRWIALTFLVWLIIAFGCAEKAPPEYHVRFSKDREMEKHLTAAHDALDDLDVPTANLAYNKARQRLQFMNVAGFSKQSISHYALEMADLHKRMVRAQSLGEDAPRIEFYAGYDPEELERPSDALDLGNLRRRLSSIPYNRRTEINHLVLLYTQGPGRKQYQIFLKRLAQYRNHVNQVFALHGLPEELLCVAMIESAGDPTRVSHAGAAGLWQFIPSTARNYGLTVNEAVDQRFDPVLQTYAAARYMKFLLKMFDNDVAAALASYNCGEGRIQEVLADPLVRSVWEVPHHGKENPKDLPTIPRETYDYIARWYAVAVVYQNLKEYNFTMPPAPDDPYMVVRTTGDIDIYKLAEDLDISPQSLIALNPSVKIGHTGNSDPVPLRLPPASSFKYVDKLRKAGTYRISFIYRHKVTAYQTLRTIAKAYNVPLDRIADLNELGENNRLEPGTILTIATSSGNAKARHAARTNVKYWRAAKGTLWDKKR